MRKIGSASLLVLALLASGCPEDRSAAPSPEAAPVSIAPAPDAAVARAKEKANAAADELTTELMGELTRAVSKRGAEGAIDVCSEVAQDLTRKLGERGGVAIRRTALRLRNPVNAPDAFERAFLERVERELAGGGAAQPVTEVSTTPAGGRELRLLRPIVFKGGVCEQCHGTSISDAVRAKLAEKYPEDKATGFKVGELRGAISVRVPVTGS